MITRKRQRAISVAQLLALLVLLTACEQTNIEDLKRYVEDVKSRPSDEIEPLPEIPQIDTYTYGAEGLRDPFSPPVYDFERYARPYTGIQPDFNRRREELEEFPLDSLRVVGTLKQKQLNWVLIRSPDGVVHRLTEGNYIGQNLGKITHISEEGLELLEIVPDGQGGWGERESSIPLDLTGELIAVNPRPPEPSHEPLVRQPYWNAWFEDGDDALPLDGLGLDQSYGFVLDLAPYDYGSVLRGLVASGSAERDLVRYVTEEPGTAKIRLRRFTAGALRTSTAPQDIVMEVAPQRFSRITNEERAYYAQFRAGQLSLREFADKVRAGWVESTVSDQRRPVTVPVQTASSAGCGVIGFSVWDESGKVPLDHLVFRVAVGPHSDKTRDCMVDEGAASFKSGFASLLATAHGKRGAAEKRVRGGLHFFEVAVTPEETLALVVLADGRDSRSIAVYSWELGVPLSDFLELEVPDLLDEAQKSAMTGNPNAYGYLSRKLRDRIFFDVKTSKRDQAKAAWQVVQELAAEKSLVVTRVVDRRGSMLYVPLGLLHAGGAEKALAGQLTVVQALPRERYVSASSCIKDWWYMLPEQLEEGSNILRTANREKPESGWLREIYVSVGDSLRQYLRYRAGEEPEPGASPEGLLTLSHQSHGAFWFDQRARKFLWGDIQRPYPPGSAAVLATCEAAGIDYENRRALDKLNERGVDLIIAAPFQVRVLYGAKLAMKLDQLLREVNTDPDPQRDRRLVTLFNQAAKQMAAESTRRRYEDMRYEFLLLGDHEARLCPPQQRGNQ